MTVRIVAERSEDDASAIDALIDLAFGHDRHRRTVYRLREGIDPIASLSLVAITMPRKIIGSLRFWPVLLPKGGDYISALLLGPIAVHPDYRGTGVGARLMRRGLDLAKAQGHHIVLLVGDASYYGQFGFKRDLTTTIALPGPVDLDRFLGLELTESALEGVAGLVKRADVTEREEAKLHAPPLYPPSR
ncbi:MAG: N-acetyltransferase [Alphaproteobacteria bacterium]